MADPLPTINIDQLTNSVTSVLASTPHADFVTPSSGIVTETSQPDVTTATSTVPSLPLVNSVAPPQTTAPVSAVPAPPLTHAPASQSSMIPVMVLAYVGGRPTLFPISDQLTDAKFTQANGNSCHVPPIVHQMDANRMTPLPAFPVSIPQQCQPSHLPQLQPLPSQTEPAPMTNQVDPQQPAQSLARQILIRPKPAESTASVPVLQPGQPVQSIPTSSGPPLPRALTPMTSQIHRLTPNDLQALINQCVQSPAMTVQPYANHSSNSNLLHLGSGEITPEQPVSHGDLSCMDTSQVVTSLPLPAPPHSQASIMSALQSQIHMNSPTMMSGGHMSASGVGNSGAGVLLETQPMDPASGSLPVSDHGNTAEQTALTNVQQFMTSLDVLSPVTNGVYPPGEYQNVSVFDLLMKAHGGELPLEKPVPEGMGKGPGCPEVAPQPVEVPAPSNTGCPTQFYCVECNISSESPCKVHECNYKHVADKPISTKARMSLPDILYLSQSLVSPNLPGVWTKSFLSGHTVFGPIIGEPKTAHECDKEKKPNFFTWKVFSDGKTEGVCVSDENQSNWMRFVKPARTAEEQNTVAYQQGREIFFITCCDLSPGQELLLWYAKDYAKALGMSTVPGMMSTCNVCSKSFPNTKSLGQHVKYSHPDMSTRKWKCEYCGRGFNSSSKLKNHVLSHMGVKPYVCTHCGKKFTEKPNLTRHMYIHTGERNFTCNVCGRGFRQKAHLQSHVLVHTGERTIRCRYCEKLFARTSDLKQHEYQHTKEKVFTCPDCNKVFYKLQNFKKHSKIHLGQKDFPCHRCEKCFFTRYHVKRHLLTCKGTKGQYTLEPEDPEIVALNMDPCVSVCPEMTTPPDPTSHPQKKTKHKTKGKK